MTEKNTAPEESYKVHYIKDSMPKQHDLETKQIITPLKNRVPKSTTGRSRGIRLPKYIIFNITADKVLQLHIQEQEAVEQATGKTKIINPTCNNMQTDNAAFEGWAITLKAWLPDKIERVTLKWDIPAKELRTKHYHRFLYRCARFEENYDWFGIDSSNRECIDDFMKHQFIDLSINQSSKTPDKKDNDENAVEYEFCDKENDAVRKPLMSHYQLDTFNHQLPVGVTSHGKLLFTGGQSAIDLWGMNHTLKTLSIFELKYINREKTTKNIKVGIISELFLYANIMRDLVKGTIVKETAKVEDEKDLYTHIRTFNNIEAVMLANEFHPLVENPDVLTVLNTTRQQDGPHLHFNYSLYQYMRGSYKLEKI